jgi:tetratricopeptide (TPR) repeat protein
MYLSIKRKAKRLTPGFVALWLALCVAPSLTVPTEAQGENRLKDLHVERQEEWTRLAFLMDRLPSLAIKDVVGSGRVSIGLADASATAPEEKRMSAAGGNISLVRADGASGVTISVPLEKGFREVAVGWLQKRSLLVVDLFPQRNGALIQTPEGATGTRKLRGVRFGPRKDFTRVVLDLDARPTFQVIWTDPTSMVLSLMGTDAAWKPERIRTVRRLKGSSLTREGNDLSLRLRCESIPLAWRVFWLDEGNRLVVDLLESTQGTSFESVELPPDFGDERKKAGDQPGQMAPSPAASLAERPDHALQSAEPQSTLPSEAPKEQAPPPPANPSGRIASGVRFVRLPIAREEKPFANSLTVEGPSPVIRLGGPPQEGQEATHGPLGDDAGGRPSDEAFTEGLEPEEAMIYGRVLEAMNFRDFKRGMELVSEFLKKFPTSRLMERMVFMRADFLFHLVESGRTDMLQEMEERYRAAISQFEGSPLIPQAYLRMAQGSAMAGQDFPALGYLNTLLAKFPGHPLQTEALLERGKAYLRAGSPEKGLQDFKAILKGSPQSPHAEKARYGVATYFYRRGMYAETLTWLKEIERLHPAFAERHPEYFSMRGQTHLYLGEYAQAREWFYRALNLGAQPETPDLILAHIGDAYLQDGQEKEAGALYKLVTETFKGTEGAVIAQLRLADFPQSDAPLKEVAEKNQATPVGELAVLKMAEVYYRRGEYPETMDALKDLVSGPSENQVQRAGLDLFVDSAEKQMAQLYSKDQLGSLIELFRKHEKILYGKMRPESQFLLSQSLQKLKRYDVAISSLNQIAPEDLGPDLGWRYFLELATAYRMTGDLEKAKDVLETGIKGQLPRDGRQRLEKSLADVLRQTGNDRAAYGLYERLIREESALPGTETEEALLSLGEILNGEGNYAKGREWLEKAADLTESDPAHADLHGGVLAAIGDGYSGEKRPKDAVRFYAKALKAGYGPERPGYWAIKFRMAEAHLALGERTLARKIFREIQEEGDADLQSRVQLRLGSMDLEDQLMRLSAWAKPSGAGHAKQ